MSQLLGAVRVLTQHQLQGRYRAVHAAGRVDAGRNGVADILRCDGFSGKAHFFQQGFHAGAVGLLQLPQAGLDQGAVLSGQGHHVRHGAHSGQVAAVIQHFLRGAVVQRGAQLKGHACAAQPFEGAGIVLPAGVHHGHCLGQGLGRQMVVGDDKVDAQLCGKVGLGYSGDAVVHRHDEPIALVMDGLDGVARQAVAIALAAGQHALDGGAHALEVLIQQCRGSHAVHVVVAEHHDGLAIVDGLPDALAGFFHIGEQGGVAQLLFPGQQGERVGRVGDAAGRQDAGQQGRLLLLGGQRGGIFLFAPGLLVHGAVFQFFGTLLRDGVGQLPDGGAVQRFQVPGTVGHWKSLPVRPSLASIPCRAAISLETSSATSLSRLS